MSEADAPADAAAGREIWIEKYRPERFTDIHGQEEIVDRLRSYVERDDLPHLLFSGPAGTGKCVTGDTPVLTNRGIERIESIVGDVDGFGSPDDGVEVLSLTDANEFEYVEPSHVFGTEASELRRIETRDGETIEVTPEHKLLVLTEDGLSWTEADDIDDGDRIARPRGVPTPGRSESKATAQSDVELNWLENIDDDRIRIRLTERFASELGHPSTTIFPDRLRALEPDTETLEAGVKSVQYVNPVGQKSRAVTPPWRLTPELARFVGLAVAEARIDGGCVKFYNTDDDLCDAFAESVRSLFDLEPERGIQKGVPYVVVRSQTLTHLLRASFDVFRSASGGAGIGSTLVSGDDESRAAFLRAMFDGEAYVSDNGIIELTQKNGDHITLISYLLSTFGIPSRRQTVRKSATNGTGIEREYHVLYVSGARNLRQFADEIGFSIERKRRRIETHARKEANPNHDTMPRQRAARQLCTELNLPVQSLLSDTLDPDNPGRVAHKSELSDVVAAATDRIEAAQEALAGIDRLSSELSDATATPAEWVRSRAQLEPIAVRRDVSESTGVRNDRLLEYADGRRTPYASRVTELLSELDERERDTAVSAGGAADIGRLKRELTTCIDTLGVTYERIAEETNLRGGDVNQLLTADGQELDGLVRFETVADRLRELASGMLSLDVIERLDSVSRVADADLYYDEVTSAETVDESRRVYDLTVPSSRNYVAGTIPTVMHNTTSATAIARAIYGDDWRNNFLELNASDERGIDVVRDRIKNFARSSFGGYDHRVIFLDEADSLCVPPGTEVVAGYPSSPEVKPIEEIADDGEPMPSVDFETNEIQSDKGQLVDSGTADFFEVKLADGRTVTASLTHPFFVLGEDGKLVETELRNLSPGDEIAEFKNDIGVSRCEVCGDWTAGRFCSLDCKDEGHSREMQGDRNPMHGTEWSDERREKIVKKLSDGRFAGENNPNYGGDFHGTNLWEMDEETVERFREEFSEMRAGTSWEEWVVDADPDAVKERIGDSMSEWWDSLDPQAKTELIEQWAESRDYPVWDITGENNPMRDPEVAQKVSEALQGHEPTGGNSNIRHSEELGHIVRSDWEYEVAKALQDAGIEYEYEPEFELSDSMFHPDFLIGDTVIEVKGVAELWGRTEKVEEFLETYGDEYTFVVVGDGELPHHEHYDREEFDPAVVSDGGRKAVQTVEIDRIDHSHRGKAYNISMRDTPNFMLANGILTHNTDDAQSALRRTMEQFSDNTRFILSCNYSSKIIDPIQSRCAVFRFSPLGDDAVRAQAEEIADAEGIEVTEDGLDALVYAADGDMRRAINALQAAATTGEVVDEDAVYLITATTRPEEIEKMVTAAIDGDFAAARSQLETLLVDAGMAGGDIIDQLHRSAWDFDLDDRTTVRLMERIGEADYRITAGANERVQLEALLASLAAEE